MTLTGGLNLSIGRQNLYYKKPNVYLKLCVRQLRTPRGEIQLPFGSKEVIFMFQGSSFFQSSSVHILYQLLVQKYNEGNLLDLCCAF